MKRNAPLRRGFSFAVINHVISNMLSLPQKRPSQRVAIEVDNDSTSAPRSDPDAF